MSEELCNQLVVVDYLKFFLLLSGVEVFENSVHALGVELEVGRNPTDPGLVHAVEVVLYDVSDFEVD